MKTITRRGFVKRTAGAIAAAMVGPSFVASSTAGGEVKGLTATTMRPLGKTGIQCTLLGMGTGVKAFGGRSALTAKGHDAYVRLLCHAYDRGLRYFDLADMYGAHLYMKEAMKNGIARDKVTLLTKTGSREADGIRADQERYRGELHTDRLDIVLMHCMTDPDWTVKLAPCMDALAEAKAKGLIRAHGVSCHEIEALRRAAEAPWVDVLLARINPFGLLMDGKREEVAPILQKARGNEKAVLGMKILGEGGCADRMEESFRYALGLGCVDAMPIGFLEPDEVDGVIECVGRVGKA